MPERERKCSFDTCLEVLSIDFFLRIKIRDSDYLKKHCLGVGGKETLEEVANYTRVEQLRLYRSILKDTQCSPDEQQRRSQSER